MTGETRLIDFGAATILKKSRYTDFQGTVYLQITLKIVTFLYRD